MDHTWTAVLCVTLALLSDVVGVRLLIGRWYGFIYLYDTESQETQVLVHDYRCSGLDYHYSKGYLYYSNEEYVKRQSIDPNINDLKIVAPDSHVRGIAVDWINDNLYWTRSYDVILVKADLDGNNQNNIITQNDIEKMEGLSNTDFLHSVVVDPYQRALFMVVGSDRSVLKGTLVRSDLEGRALTLITHNKYTIVEAFTIDPQEKRLLVFKSQPNIIIYSCNYNGDVIEEISVCPTVSWIYPIAMFRREMFMVYYPGGNFNTDTLHVESLPSVKCPEGPKEYDIFSTHGSIYDINVYGVDVQQPLDLYNANHTTILEKCSLLTTEREVNDYLEMASAETFGITNSEVSTNTSKYTSEISDPEVSTNTSYSTSEFAESTAGTRFSHFSGFTLLFALFMSFRSCIANSCFLWR